MTVQWQESYQEGDHLIHPATINEADEKAQQKAVDAVVEKAVSFLDENLTDDSLFMLFDWNTENALLDIRVSSQDKSSDAKHIVQVEISPAPEYALLSFWLKDMLASYSPFLQYSLIAAIHQGDRHQAQLL